MCRFDTTLLSEDGFAAVGFKESKAIGLYTPLVKGRSIVVNDVVASQYTW